MYLEQILVLICLDLYIFVVFICFSKGIFLFLEINFLKVITPPSQLRKYRTWLK